MKKATSSDVAKLAGVSQTTVSLVMNNKKSTNISDATRDRVLSTATALNYHHSAKSIADRKNKKNVIGVLCPTLSNPYYTHLIQIIEHYSSSKGYKVLLGNTSRDKSAEQFYLNLFSDNLVSGIIYTFLPSYPVLANKLFETIPIILIGEKQDDIKIPSIGLSNVKSGMLIGRHLIGLGHRNLAFVTTPLNNVTLSRQQRLYGIQLAMKEAGLPEENLHVVSHMLNEVDTLSNNVEYELGFSAAKEIVQNYRAVTGIIGVNDMTSLGICRGLLSCKKSVPNEYSVCGFDNILLSTLSFPQLTTIDHHLDQRASVAVNIIDDYNNFNRSDSSFQLLSVSKIEYEPQLVIRESSGIVRPAN